MVIVSSQRKLKMKQIVKRIPVIGPVARRIYRAWISPPKVFLGSENYWRDRYEGGGNSGQGSYDRLAEFKAEILNGFVSRNEIATVIEYGCGDGNQLSLAQYPAYIGFDVSSKAISMCRERFAGDDTKTFKLLGAYGGEVADLTLSLDVIYHLVEDDVFEAHMSRLFGSSKRFVIVYSSNVDENPEGAAAHVRHRCFSKWVADNKGGWKLLERIPNKYPFNGDTSAGSFADFYIYSKS